MTLLAWGVAWLLDFIIGDPQSWPHPVRWIGSLIAAVQRGVRRYCRSDVALRVGGGVMWLVVVGLTWSVCWGVLTLAQRIHPWLGWLVEVWMIFTVLAGRCLAQSARDVEDSMVGYKHEKYRAIGMVSARLDDVANFIPARLSWLLISLAALLCGEAGGRALRIGWRDRYNHSSPNCGWSEATVAGALGIRLGGPNDYFGQRVEKPWIGEATRDISVDDISRTIRLMWVSSTLALALFMAIRFWLVGAA